MQHKNYDQRIVDKRDKMKLNEQVENETQSSQLREEMTGIPPEIRFDYTYNVFNLRGDWDKSIRIIMLKLPKDINKDEKLKEFERRVNEVFRNLYSPD